GATVTHLRRIGRPSPGRAMPPASPRRWPGSLRRPPHRVATRTSVRSSGRAKRVSSTWRCCAIWWPRSSARNCRVRWANGSPGTCACWSGARSTGRWRRAGWTRAETGVASKGKRARLGAFLRQNGGLDRSGGFGLFRGVTAFAFLARQCDGGADALRDEFHQPLHDPFVRVDPGAGQNLAAIPRAGPTGYLLGPVAILLVIGNRIVERRQNVRREKLPRPLALLVVECGAVNEIAHFLVRSYCSCVYRRSAVYGLLPPIRYSL